MNLWTDCSPLLAENIFCSSRRCPVVQNAKLKKHTLALQKTFQTRPTVSSLARSCVRLCFELNAAQLLQIILKQIWKYETNFMAIYPIIVEIFHSKPQMWTSLCARGEVRGSPKSLGFIPWEPWMSVHIPWQSNEIVVGIFVSGIKVVDRLTDQHRYQYTTEEKENRKTFQDSRTFLS